MDKNYSMLAELQLDEQEFISKSMQRVLVLPRLMSHITGQTEKISGIATRTG